MQLNDMNPILPFKAIRRLSVFQGLGSKFGSLLLLFQRSPLIQMLFPEARLLGGAGMGQVTKWTVATIAGLGAYDSVAGATEISQVSPEQGAAEVPAWTGGFLNFVCQVTGLPGSDPESWSVDGLPPGLTDSDTSNPSVHVISGTPTEVGQTTVTVTAWEEPNQTGRSFTRDFLIVVEPGVILTHPASVAIASGGSTTLSIVASPGGGTTSYRWFDGTPPNGTQISGSAGNQSTFTTPNLTANKNYWVKVTKGAVVQNSNRATVMIATLPVITSQPSPTSIVSGNTATLSITTSGTPPTIQWYQGNSGVTSNPVSGATAPSFTTPVLSSTTSYWARATNPAGFVNSNAATVTVTADPYQEWRAAQFSPAQLVNPLVSGNSADPDGDSRSNEDEYVFGTSPLTREPSPLLISVNGSNQVSLSFTAKLASGTGYTGKTRHYALERRTNLSSGTWAPVAGFEDIVGGNQTFNHVTPPGSPRAFYVLRVWLTP